MIKKVNIRPVVNSIFIYLLLSATTGLALDTTAVSLTYFEDKKDQYSLRDVVEMPLDSFQKSNDNSPNISFSKSSLWVKIDLAPLQNIRVLTISNIHLDTLDVFVGKGNKTIRSFQTGDARKHSSRDIGSNFFSFLIRPGETTVYIKAHSSGFVSVPVSIRSLYEFLAFKQVQNIIIWLFYGVIFATLMANLVFYISLKDKLYLFYILYVISNAILSGIDFGLAFQYIWPDKSYINQFEVVFYSLMLFVYVFCDYFLELRSNYPKIHLIFNTLIGANILFALLSLFDYGIGMQMMTLVFTVFPLVIFFSALYVWVQSRSRFTLFFLLAWTIYLFSFLYYLLALMGIIPYSPYLSLYTVMCSTLEMVMIFVTVVFKINQIKEENIRSAAQIVELLSDREKILTDQNQMLEEKVNERTMEMHHKNDEILSQNEEIVSQNEELISQQQELLKQRQEMKIQRMELDETNKAYSEVNKRLNDYKIHLEELVNQRTNELTHANLELGEKNNQLEQYAFMAAHNLRSPIAALLGLTKFIETETDMDAIKEVTSRIRLSVKKLDIVVKSMSNILNSTNMLDNSTESILLRTILSESLGILEKEISESEAIIQADFTKCEQVMGIPTYMHNLFFNLISNSIKYKKENEKPFLSIFSEQNDTHTILRFQDIGLGIDMAKYGKDFFKPFKRFHANTEGSGVGLYLVKTQIESMGGQITMSSKLGEGTIFEIHLIKPIA